MPKLKIVPFAEEHVVPIARLEALCFVPPWSEAALREELYNPLAEFRVAVRDGEVAGYAGLLCVCDEGDITNIAVFPAYRRQGIARALLWDMFETAKARRLRKIHLEVRPSNRAALQLYEQLGFQAVGRRPRFYQHPVEDALLMTKSFEEIEE